MQKSTTYSNCSQKVALVGQLHGGDALKWFNPLFENNHPIMNNYDAFIKALKDRFGVANAAAKAARKFTVPQQGKSSVSKYATEFQNLIIDAGYDDTAARQMFRRGLAPDVKTLLLSLHMADSLEDIITKAIQCDSRLQEYWQDNRLSFPVLHVKVPIPIDSPQAQNLDPMIGEATVNQGSRARGHLSDEEKERRRNKGLCFIVVAPVIY
jgi:hypothetical protein